ncbi:HET-domain-containing protein, partial [Lojkania enalia]
MAHCQVCNDLEKRDELEPRLAFDFTPTEILRSAFEQGCESCIIILESLRQSETADWSFRQDVRLVCARCCEQKEKNCDSLFLDVFFIDDRQKLELEVYSLQPHGESFTWRAILPRPSISGHPLSPGALAWVRSLLGECTAQHGSCTNSKSRRLPKRVLSLRQTNDGLYNVKLIEPTGKYAPYAALSHCWGNERTCLTLRSNFEDQKQDISWSTMPKTFRDAIVFAMQLDISLLWIDSLCIIQDDPTDWEIESSKMADVYQYATLTLAATASTSDSAGCFSEDENRPNYIEIITPENVADTSRIAVRQALKHWNVSVGNDMLSDFPLLSRAWAFQERLLAPRVLHFCASELVWECRELTICECGALVQEGSPCGMYFNVVKSSEDEAKHQALDRQGELDFSLALQLQRLEELEEAAVNIERAQDEDENREEPEKDHGVGVDEQNTEELVQEHLERVGLDVTPVQHFHRLVEQYSRLRLTKQSDRLPALSGLCERVQHLRGDYWAGLWSKSIAFDLMWRVNTLNLDANNGGRALEYRAPSWSWAAIESPVNYWHDITDDYSSIEPTKDSEFQSRRALLYQSGSIKVSVELAGQNPFGEVNSAILTV